MRFESNPFSVSRAIALTRFLKPSPADLDLWPGDLLKGLVTS